MAQHLFRAPAHSNIALSNGARLVFVQHPSARLTHIRIVVPLTRFSDADAALSALVARALFLPYADENEPLPQRLLALGAEFTAVAMPDRLLLSGVTHPDRLAESLALIFKALRRPLTAAELDLTRASEMARMHALMTLPSSQVRHMLATHRWGDHPLGREAPSPPALLEVDAEAYDRFLFERIGSGNALVIVAASSASSYAAAEEEIGNWRSQQSTDVMPALDTNIEGNRYALAVRGAGTVTMQYMGAAPQRHHPDHAAFRTASVILGGYSGSRLLRRLRDQDGTIYQALGGAEDMRGASTHTIHIDCMPQRAPYVERRFASIVDEFCQSGPTTRELVDATQYMISSVPVFLGPASAYVSAAAGLLAVGGTLDYWETMEKSVTTLVTDDIVRSARQYLVPEHTLLGVYGTE